MTKWRMEPDNDMHGNSWWQIDTADGSESVADVWEEEYARLIIKAPEMAAEIERLETSNANLLAACQLFMRWRFSDSDPVTLPELRHVETAMEAAIAKAEAAT